MVLRGQRPEPLKRRRKEKAQCCPLQPFCPRYRLLLLLLQLVCGSVFGQLGRLQLRDRFPIKLRVQQFPPRTTLRNGPATGAI